MMVLLRNVILTEGIDITEGRKCIAIRIFIFMALYFMASKFLQE